MRIADESIDSPPGDDDAEKRKGDRDWCSIARPPGVVEADVADAVQSVVEGDEQERDIDGDEPGILKEAALNDFEREALGRADFGGEVLDPEVHDEQHQQGGARDALQVPVECSAGHFLRGEGDR